MGSLIFVPFADSGQYSIRKLNNATQAQLVGPVSTRDSIAACTVLFTADRML
jgi:hypothetical protein